jgi:hypothetical protein
LEFAAVGTAQIQFVAGDANRDRVAGLPFAGNVAIGRGGFVFPGVDYAPDVDHDGAAEGVTGGLSEDLGLGLVPVIGVAAFDRSATLEKLSSAPPDSFVHLVRIVPRSSRHTHRLAFSDFLIT